MKGLASKVVDINEFKAARAAQQMDLLDAQAGGRSETLETDRSLSAREVAHRTRMLAHLGTAK